MGSQRQRSEPQVDRDPTLFFSGQTIGVDSCQGTDQSCLAVVDMPRRSQDQIALAACHRRLAKGRSDWLRYNQSSRFARAWRWKASTVLHRFRNVDASTMVVVYSGTNPAMSLAEPPGTPAMNV